MLYFEHHYKFRTILYSLEPKNHTKLWVHGNCGRTETGDTTVLGQYFTFIGVLLVVCGYITIKGTPWKLDFVTRVVKSFVSQQLFYTQRNVYCAHLSSSPAGCHLLEVTVHITHFLMLQAYANNTYYRPQTTTYSS